MCANEDTGFDEMIKGIQDELDNEAAETFSKIVIEEFKNPQNVGRMKVPDSLGIITGPCGDTMEIYLKVENNNISDIQFMTDGCGATIACGSMVTKMVKGKPLEGVKKITNLDLIEALDGLPAENLHCAKLTVDTVQAALTNYDKRHNNSQFKKL